MQRYVYFPTTSIVSLVYLLENGSSTEIALTGCEGVVGISLDRLSANQVSVTQERIANTLGVRRERVTEAAGRLQAEGLIEYRRGRIQVLDRPGLEARVCECYEVVKREYERLLPPVPRC